MVAKPDTQIDIHGQAAILRLLPGFAAPWARGTDFTGCARGNVNAKVREGLARGITM
jgi:hypothetical protein